MRRSIFGNSRGFSLIELLIALVVGGILIAAFYQSVISQQRTFTVQEQVVDTQQNVRIAMDPMALDIEMAGFGNVKDIIGFPGGVNGFTSIVTPGANTITVITAGRQKILADDGSIIVIQGINGTQLNLSHPTGEFNGEAHKYVSIGGLESFVVPQPAPKGTILRLDRGPKINPIGHCLYKIWAITYDVADVDGRLVLRRNTNTGGSPDVMAEDIEMLQFKYYDANGAETAVAGNIRMVWANLNARTAMADPAYKTNGGFRKRAASSYFAIRNR